MEKKLNEFKPGERGVVLRAQLIPGARELLEVLSLPRE